MAWSNFAFETGMAGLQGITSFIVANKEAKSAKRWQEWRNKVTRLANAQNQNNITTNTNLALQRDQLAKQAIAKSKRITLASTEVAAAVMGTRGNSVAQTMRAARHNADEADMRRQINLETSLVGFQAQRESSELQTFQQTEFSPIPTPTGAAELMGFATSALESYQKNKSSIRNKL